MAAWPPWVVLPQSGLGRPGVQTTNCTVFDDGHRPGAQVQRIDGRSHRQRGHDGRTELEELGGRIRPGIPDVEVEHVEGVHPDVAGDRDSRHPTVRQIVQAEHDALLVEARPVANVAQTVRSAPIGLVGLQKNSRLLTALDRGAVTTTVPGRGLAYV